MGRCCPWRRRRHRRQWRSTAQWRPALWWTSRWIRWSDVIRASPPDLDGGGEVGSRRDEVPPESSVAALVQGCQDGGAMR
uniref:Uncharacterized protein n=1 Tax=Triticum urartu TaxID=4572 RepID=A0A8R7VA73_TRIUA